MTWLYGLITRTLGCDPEEARPVWLAFLFHFFLLSANYIIQPLRDESAQLLGADVVTSLFRWSLVVVLLANPLFSLAMVRIPRPQLVPALYRFFGVNLLGFIALFRIFGGSNGEALSHGWARAIPTCFYLWVTAYSLIVVSLFWSKMADQFSSEQSKRLFGFVGAGGSLGQFFGSFVASKGVHWLGPTYLLLVVALMLELSVRCCRPLEATGGVSSAVEEPSRPVRPWSGLSALFRSPYLLGICAYVFLYTFTSSFIYLQKQQMVQDSISNRADKVSFFADINLIGSVCQVAIQLLLTGQIMTRLGLVFSLTLVPVVTAGGFAILAAQPVLRVLALFEIVRKTLNFAVARPSREVLFTVLPRREKYLAKNAIDTFVYRAGDGLASIAFDVIKISLVGLSGTALAVRYSLAAIPFAMLWVLTAAGLALAQRRRAEALAAAE